MKKFQRVNNNNKNNEGNLKRETEFLQIAAQNNAIRTIHIKARIHTNKLYMHNPSSVQENDTHKPQWDFDIQTDHLISTRRLDLIIINNKKELADHPNYSIIENG